MKVCCINECKEEGIHSIKNYLSPFGVVSYESKDGEIFFCNQHIIEYSSLYYTYKETEIEANKIFWDFKKSSILISGELYKKSYELRELFQSKLKSSLMSEGHSYWIQHLKDKYIRCKEIYEEQSQYGQNKWDKKYNYKNKKRLLSKKIKNNQIISDDIIMAPQVRINNRFILKWDSYYKTWIKYKSELNTYWD